MGYPADCILTQDSGGGTMAWQSNGLAVSGNLSIIGLSQGCDLGPGSESLCQNIVITITTLSRQCAI